MVPTKNTPQRVREIRKIIAVAEVWRSGDRERAAKLVTEAMVGSIAIIGDAGECRERIAEHLEGGEPADTDIPGMVGGVGTTGRETMEM